jgi:hypothetical protein
MRPIDIQCDPSGQKSTQLRPGGLSSTAPGPRLSSPPATWLRKLEKLRDKQQLAAEREWYQRVDELRRQIAVMENLARAKGWEIVRG